MTKSKRTYLICLIVLILGSCDSNKLIDSRFLGIYRLDFRNGYSTIDLRKNGTYLYTLSESMYGDYYEVGFWKVGVDSLFLEPKKKHLIKDRECPNTRDFKIKINYDSLIIDGHNIFTRDKQVIKKGPIWNPDKFPEFPGGELELIRYVKTNLQLPNDCNFLNNHSRVTIRFVVNSNGEILDAVVIKGVDAACDKEALRVIGLMPLWIPGQYEGRNISTYYTLPIDFGWIKNKNYGR
jgi:hypothetical protein